MPCGFGGYGNAYVARVPRSQVLLYIPAAAHSHDQYKSKAPEGKREHIKTSEFEVPSTTHEKPLHHIPTKLVLAYYVRPT